LYIMISFLCEVWVVWAYFRFN